MFDVGKDIEKRFVDCVVECGTFFIPNQIFFYVKYVEGSSRYCPTGPTRWIWLKVVSIDRFFFKGEVRRFLFKKCVHPHSVIPLKLQRL
jgi:hypothetical protein